MQKQAESNGGGGTYWLRVQVLSTWQEKAPKAVKISWGGGGVY